ncbi:hypothetical protein [Paenibacillus azoreducens]|uniref:Uncharacterized protein n=1 Tax=Paenibacillus azoreducens TaxID=116718 RepID=A0A919YAF7_9BACL|nr:hypothetical protein [Paenibacillus azoreducens]GIO45240.1 hypothetical protein J34TS1_00050 [Paenibacillus azoreducens]
MYKPVKTYAVILVSTLLLGQSFGYGAYAAPALSAPKLTAAAAFTLDRLGSVALKSKVSVKLTDIDIFAQPSGNILTYTLRYNNDSGSSVALIDYFSRITTSGGTVVQGKPVTSDSSIKRIPAHSSQSITYYANIGKAAKVDGVKVSIFGWDFSSTDYQKRLGVFTVPDKYSTVVPKGQSQKIMMNGLPVMAKAESLQKIQMNGKTYLKAGISLVNQGAKALSDPGYKAYLKSSGGSVFALSLTDDSSNFKVQPQEKKTIYYLTEMPSYMKTDNMQLQWALEDEVLKVNLPVKSFHLPAVTVLDSTVPNYAVKKLMIAGNAVETQLKGATMYAENGSAKWSLQFRFKNLGNKPVTLPAYEFAVKTAEGYSIPVDAKALANLALKPLDEKIIDLGADVPLKLNQGSLQLQMSEPPAQDKIIFPAARYAIPYSRENSSVPGVETLFENSHGTFAVKLSSYQRVPWEDGDQITAKVAIRNASSRTVQMPSLKALIKTEMNDLSGSAKMLGQNGPVSLAPNETAEMYVLANVPYSLGVDQLRIILQETIGDEAKPFLALNAHSLSSKINTAPAGSTYHIQTAGKKAEIRERKSTVYGESNSNLIYTELEMTSEEARQSKPVRLVAFYKTHDNQYYEATVSQSSNIVSPKGKNLITVWSKLPLSVDTSKLVLYLGAGIEEGKLAEAEGTITGYVDAFGLSLSPSGKPPVSNLKNVDLFPYSLSINKAESTLNEGEDVVETLIRYTLTKNGDFETGTYEHKIVLEFIDPLDQSTEITLTPGTDWTIGNNKSYNTTLKNSLYQKLAGGNIRVNLYDEFQGRRMLLGTEYYPIQYIKTETKDNETKER